MKQKPIIYQVLPRLFGNCNETCKPNGTVEENGVGKFNDFTPAVLRRFKGLGVTHVWYTGIIRHATQTDYSAYGIPKQHPEVVKGMAGSPYAIADYYDVDPDLAVNVNERMAEWEALIERTHSMGLKVIMDFVPNHVAREYHSVCCPEGVVDLGANDDTSKHFSTDNNFYYCWGQPLVLEERGERRVESEKYSECPAKATGNDVFNAHPSRNDWYETVKLNYGIDYCDAGGRSEHFDPVPDTWHKMLAILLFWAEKGVDGFRCDMAEMVPVAFWHWATDRVKNCYPDILFIGEVYNPAEYRNYIGAGFDWLYDKVGMYDCVREVISSGRRAGDITHKWQQNDDIRSHMLYFLENHDEQRIASDFFAGNVASSVPGLLVSVLLQSNPFMLYSGQEFGERGMDEEGYSGRDGRTTIFDYWSLETLRQGYFNRKNLSKEYRNVENLYKYVLNLVNAEAVLREGDFFDLMYVNQHIAERQFAFLRKHDNEAALVLINFDDKTVECDVNIPQHSLDYLNIPQCTYKAKDLLSAEYLTIDMQADKAVSMTVPAYGGRVLKFKTEK